jgi:sugar lactone lactonase YvrE
MIIKTIYFFSFLILFGIYSCKEQTDISKSGNQDSEATLEYEIKAALGEGAIWNDETRELYWVDILKKELHIYNPKTHKNRSFSIPSPIGTVVPMQENEAIIALDDGIYLIDTKTGDIQLFSDVEADMPGNRFNDGKCDPAGRFWVGSMHYGQSEPAANLYMISGDGTATIMLDSVTISNGIVWTKDKKTMYYIDTPTGVIRAFDFNVKTGAISNERNAVEVPDSLGYPDGMAIDEEDMLWVGMWNGNSVARFNPISGKLISKIEVPAHNVTACAFGGDNLGILYITTSSVDMTEEETQQYPLAGSIFKAIPGVKGVKSPFFKKTIN